MIPAVFAGQVTRKLGSRPEKLQQQIGNDGTGKTGWASFGVAKLPLYSCR